MLLEIYGDFSLQIRINFATFAGFLAGRVSRGRRGGRKVQQANLSNLGHDVGGGV